MKYWKLFVIFGLVTVVVIAVVIFSFQTISQTNHSTPTSTNYFTDDSSTASNISTFTTNCFKSYIQSYTANAYQTNPSQYDQNAQLCFTTSFINQWPSIINNSEADPVLLSQDYDASWTTDISALVSSQSQTTASVVVNLGTGSETKELLANLQLTSEGWRISSVESPQ